MSMIMYVPSQSTSYPPPVYSFKKKLPTPCLVNYTHNTPTI